MIRKFLAATFLAGVAMASPASATKNIIIMIADGAGFNMLDATRLYTGTDLAVDGNGFVSTAVSTYPLRTSTSPIAGEAGLAQNPNAVYDPAKNWDTTPVAGTTGGYPRGFEGYEWNRQNAPDSANTIVSLMTGQKTYNNAVNVNGNGDALLTVAELAVKRGREAGVVSTVAFGDATPAVGGGAHNVSRNNRHAIANEMFSAGTLSVIGGTGNPDFDDNGNMLGSPNYGWISEALWTDLKDGTNNSGYNGQNWTLLQNAEDIAAIANMEVSAPEKLAMITKAFNGNNQYRGDAGLIAGTEDPFATALRNDVPTLTDLSLAALNRLNQNGSDGLYLLAEQGEVDRSMHANNLGRAIEAYIEFNQAVLDVIAWVDSDLSAATWDNTLLIVSADHDHLLFGPDAATDPFQSVLQGAGGPGSLPEHMWLSGSHSNQLVPLFAKGAGADDILALATLVDSYTDEQGRTFGRGNYTDQAVIGQYLLGAANTVPEPATWAMLILGFGVVGIAARRRRAEGATAA